jgi:hypothetical protein
MFHTDWYIVRPNSVVARLEDATDDALPIRGDPGRG